MIRWLLFFLCVCWTITVHAADLNQSDASLIASAGIPVYSMAIFAYGNSDVGFRFASSISPEEVRQWYREKLPEWSVLDQYGSWILYDGNPGAGLGEVMSKPQILIKENEYLPGWHSLEKNMTTEITIMVPK